MIYCITLPFYTSYLSLLYLNTGSYPLVKAAQLLKDVTAVVALISVFLVALYQRKHIKLLKIDFLVLLFLGLSFVYLCLPINKLSFTTKLFSFRISVFFVLVYLLGRSIPLSIKSQKRVLHLITGVGALAGLVTIIEFTSATALQEVIGYSRYMKVFFGVDAIGHYGLTWTFETDTGMRRYAAFFSNPLELSASMLMTVPAAFGIYKIRKEQGVSTTRVKIMIALSVIALLLALSRASLVAFFVEFTAAAFWLNELKVLKTVFIGLFCFMLSLFLFASEKVFSFIEKTISFENNSSKGHLEEWKEGAESMLHYPLGIGLGTSGNMSNLNEDGQQEEKDNVGGENQYIITGVQLGVAGLLIYVLILYKSIQNALVAFRLTEGYTKWLCFTAAATKFGLLIPLFTANVEIYLYVAIVSWWLVGFSARTVSGLIAQKQTRQAIAI
jgi:hypothetical protein